VLFDVHRRGGLRISTGAVLQQPAEIQLDRRVRVPDRLIAGARSPHSTTLQTLTLIKLLKATTHRRLADIRRPDHRGDTAPPGRPSLDRCPQPLAALIQHAHLLQQAIALRDPGLIDHDQPVLHNTANPFSNQVATTKDTNRVQTYTGSDPGPVFESNASRRPRKTTPISTPGPIGKAQVGAGALGVLDRRHCALAQHRLAVKTSAIVHRQLVLRQAVPRRGHRRYALVIGCGLRRTRRHRWLLRAPRRRLAW
jgi:hypothetical protein